MRNFSPSLRGLLTPFARSLLVILLVIALAMGGLHAFARLPGIPPFWARLFNLDAEFTLGPLLTATVLLAGGLVAAANGLWADLPRLWKRLYWWLLGGLLVFLSFDVQRHRAVIAYLLAFLGRKGELDAVRVRGAQFNALVAQCCALFNQGRHVPLCADHIGHESKSHIVLLSRSSRARRSLLCACCTSSQSPVWVPSPENCRASEVPSLEDGAETENGYPMA